MLAMALSCAPDVLIVDEPTSGQDMLTRATLLAFLDRVRRHSGTSLLLISHDLAAVARLADRVAVLYAGKLAEVGPARDVLQRPRHPYAWGLLNAYPNMTTARDLRGVRGSLPDPAHPPAGCRFHPRCTQAVDECRRIDPPLQPIGDRLIACHLGGLQTLLRVDRLAKTFSLNGNGFRVEAVRDASLDVLEGEVVAVIGETGSGKTTLGRLVAGMLDPESGAIAFKGKPSTASGPALKDVRKQVQLIPQDPFDTVSPRLTVAGSCASRSTCSVSGARRADGGGSRALAAVGLPDGDSFLARRPHELSGGQLQRVVSRGRDARAEADRGRRARVDARRQRTGQADQPAERHPERARHGPATDLARRRPGPQGGRSHRGHARRRDHRSGPASRVVTQPQHAYTRALLSAAPAFDWFEDAILFRADDRQAAPDTSNCIS